jgi:hypothetical protein
MPYAWYPSPVYAILTSGNMLRAMEFRNQHAYAVRHDTLVPTVSKRSQFFHPSGLHLSAIDLEWLNNYFATKPGGHKYGTISVG